MPEEKYYVSVPKYRGYIAALQMYAPIISPIGVTKVQLQQMLLSGVEVFLYDRATKCSRQITLQELAGTKTAENTNPKPVEPPKEPKVLTGAPIAPANVPEEAPAEEPETPPTETPAETAEEPVAETPTEETSDDTTNPQDETTETPVENPTEEEWIDESKVDWSHMTRAERRAMRAKINAQNEALAAKNAETSSDTETAGNAETVVSTETTQSED